MASFNTIINIAFLSLFTYHVVSFAVQYFIAKRIELLYYSLYLLCGSIYYLLFFNLPIFPEKAIDAVSDTTNTIRMTVALFQIFVYTLFTIAYLNINPQHKWIYQFFRAYLVFVPVTFSLYLAMYFLHIDRQLFLAIFYSLTIPVLVIYFIAISRLMTLHSNIYQVGTVLNMIGTMISYLMGLYWKDSVINHHVPAQIGLLLDLFVLSYGLSLKAAESDKKLVVVLLENQKLLEVERGRFARDLHDGLGGLLSSVKFSFSNLKENIILSGEQEQSFDQSLAKLDSGISELRRIAYNIMPENLQQFGLDVALKDFCLTIQQGTGCSILCESFGMKDYLSNQTTDTGIYRIAQELINNALKHARASRVIVQLQKEKKQLILTVEDNGKGFSVATLKTEKGSGWKSIDSRVNLLRGTVHIESTAKGTTVSVEIPV